MRITFASKASEYFSPRKAMFALVAAGGLSACTPTSRPLQGVPLPVDPNTAAVVGGAVGAWAGDRIDPNGGGAYYGAAILGGLARDEAQQRGVCDISSTTYYDPVTGRVTSGVGSQACNQRGPYEGVSAGNLGLPSGRRYFADPDASDTVENFFLGM